MNAEILKELFGNGEHQLKASLKIDGNKVSLVLTDDQGGKFDIGLNQLNSLQDYVDYVVSTSEQNKTGLYEMDFLQWSSGMSEEAGEVLAMARKGVFHKSNIDHVDVVTELGDLLYYLIATLNTVGSNLGQVAKANLIKLNSRYPHGRRDLAFKDKKMEYTLIKKHLDGDE